MSLNRDSDLADFLYRWNTSLMRMHTRPDDENLRDMFLDQMRKSQAMKHVLELWDDMEPDGPEKTYKWLHDRLERHIERKRASGNVESFRRIVTAPGIEPPPALPAPEKQKKNTPCKFHKLGTCTKGKQCEYDHSGPKGKPPTPKEVAVPAPPQKGKGRGRSSEPTAKAPCWNFADGKCTRADCPREHRRLTPAEKKEKEEKQKARSQSTGPEAKKPVDADCFAWKKSGSCIKGYSCLYNHAGKEKEQRDARSRANNGNKNKS